MNKRDLGTNIVIRAMIKKGYRDLKSMHRNTKDAGEKNRKLLFKILNTNKSSEYGRKYHFDEIKTVEDYRRMVPMTDFDDYEPYVIRNVDGGEKNLMTSLPILGYAQSSGSVGRRKFVPITQPQINIYTKYTVTRMLALADRYSRRVNGRGLKAARGMFTCPSFDDTFPNGMLCSNIADVAAKQLGFIYPYILNIPFKKMFNEHEAESKYVNTRFALEDKNTLFMFCIFFREITGYISFLKSNWETIVDDIEKGTVSDLAMATPEAMEKLKSVITPNPERAAELRAEFEKGFDETLFKRLWPNMSVIYGIGTSVFTPFAERARNYTKGIPYDYSVHAASEGLFAVVDELDSPDRLMLTDSCFYEFIPQDDEDTILCIDELEVGKEYEIVITNQAGLYRYRIGDVVKVVRYMNDCPYVHFSYRKGQLLNITGEKTTEEHMLELISEIEKAADCTIEDWAVYNEIEEHPYYYVLLIENEEGKDLRTYTEMAHEALCRINPRYAYFSGINGMGKIVIENQKPGTHSAWRQKMIENGAPPSQLKPVRYLESAEKGEFFWNRTI